ncbi:ATP-binding cassette domain-containing protein [Halocalculus aciditolerans]
MLTIDSLEAGYGEIQVLHGVDLSVEKGEIVALIGSNGAGKTTTLRAVSGIIPATAGTITYDGGDITDADTEDIVDRGLVQVPESRELFGDLSVRENLLLGAQRASAVDGRDAMLDRVYELFPRLEEREEQAAETMSGGEQQMLAIGRALMGDPDLLVLDEPTEGLAPKLVQDVFDAIREIHAEGMTVFLVEQNVKQTLSLADRGYVMENGRTTLSGTGEELLEADEVIEAYLGA